MLFFQRFYRPKSADSGTLLYNSVVWYCDLNKFIDFDKLARKGKRYIILPKMLAVSASSDRRAIEGSSPTATLQPPIVVLLLPASVDQKKLLPASVD